MESCFKWPGIREWLPLRAGVPQESTLDPLFFLIYIKDLSNDIVCTVKLCVGDTSLFSIVHDANTAKKFCMGISVEMSFYPDLNKQAEEVVFSRKTSKSSYPII